MKVFFADLCCLSYLLFKNLGPGRGPRRRHPARTLNLFRTQKKRDPAILPRTTAVADPEFPCAWKQLLKFLPPKPRRWDKSGGPSPPRTPAHRSSPRKETRCARGREAWKLSRRERFARKPQTSASSVESS